MSSISGLIPDRFLECDGAAPNLAARDLGEPALDFVEPRSAGRRVAQVVVRAAGQPVVDHDRLVRAVVVQREMDVQAGRDRLVDDREELLEIKGPVAAETLADGLAGGGVEVREERRDPVVLAVLRQPRRCPGRIGRTGRVRSSAGIRVAPCGTDSSVRVTTCSTSAPAADAAPRGRTRHVQQSVAAVRREVLSPPLANRGTGGPELACHGDVALPLGALQEHARLQGQCMESHPAARPAQQILAPLLNRHRHYSGVVVRDGAYRFHPTKTII